ncbi:hypothetical protein OH77DRAFT_1415982, partial [Trametes cingulata]
PEVLAFRSLQAQTATLISGAHALHFMTRASVTSTELDLHVHLRHRRDIGTWLLTSGYSFIPTLAQHPDFHLHIVGDTYRRATTRTPSGVCDVVTFQKAQSGGSTLNVRMIVSWTTPAATILCSPSTCLLNVITFNTAYCLFPRATLHERRALLLRYPDGSPIEPENVAEQHDALGFEPPLSHLEARQVTSIASNLSFPLGWRWIDDAATWVVSLDTVGVSGPLPANKHSTAMTHDPVSVCNYAIRYDSERGAWMDLGVAHASVLRYSYIISDELLIDKLCHAIEKKVEEERRKAEPALEGHR